MPRYWWDDAVARYRNARGQFVSNVRGALDEAIENSAAAMKQASEQLREVVRDHGALSGRDPEHVDSVALIGHAGRIYLMTGDFAYFEPRNGIAAIGCGDQVAHGALYALKATGHSRHEDMLTYALDAAAEYSAGVSGDTTILRMRTGEAKAERFVDMEYMGVREWQEI